MPARPVENGVRAGRTTLPPWPTFLQSIGAFPSPGSPTKDPYIFAASVDKWEAGFGDSITVQIDAPPWVTRTNHFVPPHPDDDWDWTVTFINNTRQIQASINVNFPAIEGAPSNAAWIVESVVASDGPTPFPRFGTLFFDHASAVSANGVTFPATSTDSDVCSLQDDEGVVLSTATRRGPTIVQCSGVLNNLTNASQGAFGYSASSKAPVLQTLATNLGTYVVGNQNSNAAYPLKGFIGECVPQSSAGNSH